MTGIDLYDRLRHHTALGQQPAIIFTAARRSEQLERAAVQRQITIVAKPFNIEDLLNCIEQTLSCCATSLEEDVTLSRLSQ